MRTKRVFLLLSCLCFAACAFTHMQTLDWSVQPKAVVPAKLPGSVAVVIPLELRSLVESASPAGIRASAHTYKFPVGERLVPTLLAATGLVYDSVADVPSQPGPGAYDLILVFQRQSSQLNIAVIQGFFSESQQASYSLTLDIQAFDGHNLEHRQGATVSGGGSTNKKFGLAIQGALQQAGDNLATILVSGFGTTLRSH